MSAAPWFYYPFEQLQRAELELSGEEANHILGARRKRVGDALVLSNGRGRLAHCTLAFADRRARVLRLQVERLESIEQPARQLILAAALPKGDRLATMLDMCCQLEKSRFPRPLEIFCR